MRPYYKGDVMFNVRPRNIAKFAVRVATTATAAYAAETALTAVIGDTDEDASLHTGSLTIGALAGYSIAKRTDAMVDKIADKLTGNSDAELEPTPVV